MLKRRSPAQQAPTPSPPAVDVAPVSTRPEAPADAHHLVVVVLDSLRYDSCAAASMPNLSRLGDLERRWSYASWTAPSHHNLLMGLMPHANPTNVYASEYYKQDFARYAERLGVPGIEFKTLLPSIWLPTFLRQSLGYRTSAFVSMPVLNPRTPVNLDFDRFELMPRHNDMAAMLDRLEFNDGPSFHLLNIGETHYPYAIPQDDPSEWPRLPGVHGVVRGLDDAQEDEAPAFFDDGEMEQLRARQVRAASYIDGVLEKLFDTVPAGTWIVVTADHGELFGEGGFFGHGPIVHEKVFEVPFIEGLLR